MEKNILLLSGGGGLEHEISLISAQYIRDSLQKSPELSLISVEIDSDGEWIYNDQHCQLQAGHNLVSKEHVSKIDCVIPCFHGHPGETGVIQAYFEQIKIPYIGNGPEASSVCFNKLTTKLWLSSVKIPNTPYLSTSKETITPAIKQFFSIHKKVVVKAASQGSSVGCYLVEDESKLQGKIAEALQYSDFVLIEKQLHGRELEIATYEIDGTLHISDPGEIICPSSFYDYEEKYSKESSTETIAVAKNITKDQMTKLKEYSQRSFKEINLRHMSRIDFFLSTDGEIYLNEINTFPGLTPISMFPKMMESNGHQFGEFLKSCINSSIS